MLDILKWKFNIDKTRYIEYVVELDKSRLADFIIHRIKELEN